MHCEGSLGVFCKKQIAFVLVAEASVTESGGSL